MSGNSFLFKLITLFVVISNFAWADASFPPPMLTDASNFAPSGQSSVPSKIPLRNRWSWSPSQWFVTATAPAGGGNWGTAFLTVSVPDDFYAVRVGFANISSTSYTVPLIKVVPSTTRNDYINPTGGASWITLTTAFNGADSSRIVVKGGAPTSLTVAGNATDITNAGTDNPVWSWTDWVPVNSTTPDPTTGMRILMLRHLMNKDASTVTFANGTFLGVADFPIPSTSNWTSNTALNGGYDYYVGGINNGSDFVTTTGIVGPPEPLTTTQNALTNGSIVAAVQVMTVHAGLTTMAVGPSEVMGTTTTSSFANFQARMTASLGNANIGKFPIGWANAAVGGMTSDKWLSRLFTYISAFQPGVVFLLTWDANDKDAGNVDTLSAELVLARALQGADIARANGAIPIFLTPTPIISSSPGAELTAWQTIYNKVIGFSSREIVVDEALAFGAVAATPQGSWPGGSPYTNDQVHFNDAGQLLIGQTLIQPILKRMFGL